MEKRKLLERAAAEAHAFDKRIVKVEASHTGQYLKARLAGVGVPLIEQKIA